MGMHLFKNSLIHGFRKTAPKGFLRFQGSRSGHFKALRTDDASPPPLFSLPFGSGARGAPIP